MSAIGYSSSGATRDQVARLLGNRRTAHRPRQGQHGLRHRPDRDFSLGDLRAMAWAGRPLSGLDDPAAAPYRHGRLSARHRRTRPRHAGPPDLWRPAVADHRHSAGDPGFRDWNFARSRCRLCRRQDQHRDHAYDRRILCLSLGAARDRDFGRPGGRHRQFHRIADHCLHAANHPRRRKRHHQRSQHGFRRSRACVGRRPFHHHARAYARQRVGTDFRLRHRPDLGVDDFGRRTFISRSRHQATGAGMGTDAQHACAPRSMSTRGLRRCRAR